MIYRLFLQVIQNIFVNKIMLTCTLQLVTHAQLFVENAILKLVKPISGYNLPQTLPFLFLIINILWHLKYGLAVLVVHKFTVLLK